jgi:hypothetical protein
MLNNNLKPTIALLACCCLLQFASAQPKDNDILSRLGIGSAVPQDFIASQAMGGLGASYYDIHQLNLVNPAASSFLQLTSFEVGGFARRSKLSLPNNADYSAWGGNISYIALGFPLQNPLNTLTSNDPSRLKWGMSLGLVPQTQVAYDIQNTFTQPDTILASYEGTGGTYKFIWNNSVRYKNLSAGLGLGYMFGKLSYNHQEDFQDYLFSSYSNRSSNQYSVKGLTWNAGLLYRYELPQTEAEKDANKPKRFANFGAFGRSAQNLKTASSYYDVREHLIIGTIDTIAVGDGVEGNMRLPAEFGIGATLVQETKWKLGINYHAQKWSDYTNDARPETLFDSWRLSAGGELTPNYRSYNSYFERVRYRMGVFYGKDARGYAGEQLGNYGLTLGAGFPMIVQNGVPSFMNFGFEMGQIKGSSASGLKQNYFRLSLGFALNDNTWFYKRKFE